LSLALNQTASLKLVFSIGNQKSTISNHFIQQSAFNNA